MKRKFNKVGTPFDVQGVKFKTNFEKITLPAEKTWYTVLVVEVYI